jgi:hypothetical protein
VSQQVNLSQVNHELAAALEELARLAWEGVPGCDGASVSVLREESVSTWASTQPRVREVDVAQYRNGDGPCVRAIRERHVVSVEDYRREPRWPAVAAKRSRPGSTAASPCRW